MCMLLDTLTFDHTHGHVLQPSNTALRSSHLILYIQAHLQLLTAAIRKTALIMTCFKSTISFTKYTHTRTHRSPAAVISAPMTISGSVLHTRFHSAVNVLYCTILTLAFILATVLRTVACVVIHTSFPPCHSYHITHAFGPQLTVLSTDRKLCADAILHRYMRRLRALLHTDNR